MTKILTGSQGTLGIITKIKLKLVEPRKYSKMLLIFLKDLKGIANVRDIVIKYSPESFESYDDKTFKVAIKFLPAFLKKIFKKNKESDKKVNFLKLAFSF